MAYIIARPILFIVFLLGSFNIVSARQIDSVLSVYADRFKQEKLHIHFDRTTYNKDETIYYKVYLLDELNASSLSKNLYVDWYNP